MRRRQAVSSRSLIPIFVGSNPTASTKYDFLLRCLNGITLHSEHVVVGSNPALPNTHWEVAQLAERVKHLITFCLAKLLGRE